MERIILAWEINQTEYGRLLSYIERKKSKESLFRVVNGEKIIKNNL